jgi:hypothetical protein
MALGKRRQQRRAMEGAWVPVEGGLDCDAGSLHVLWRSVSTVYKAAKHNGITCRTPADPGASAGTKLVLSQYNKYIGLRTSTSELDSEGDPLRNESNNRG